ncbi:MAG TPA: response regulator [Polyangiaceae bacterium]|nr:response regulator [Polyangiaceae bacterium]
MKNVPGPKSQPVRRPLRLLLVDDEPAVLRGLRRVIAQRRPLWELHCESGGTPALARLAETHIDCLVTDLQMPNMDGMTLLTRVREQHPSCVRLVHSSQIETTGRGQVAALCHRVIEKPATPDAVIATLDWALQLAVYRDLTGTTL